LLQHVGRQRRTISAATIQNKFGVFFRKGLHDIALDNSATHVHRTSSVSGLKLIVFSYVDQRGSSVHPFARLSYTSLFDASLRIANDGEKFLRMDHMFDSLALIREIN